MGNLQPSVLLNCGLIKNKKYTQCLIHNFVTLATIGRVTSLFVKYFQNDNKATCL